MTRLRYHPWGALGEGANVHYVAANLVIFLISSQGVMIYWFSSALLERTRRQDFFFLGDNEMGHAARSDTVFVKLFFVVG